MNIKRFTAKTSRDALALVRQAFGDDAVVMSTKPCDDGVEVLAMAPESIEHFERLGAATPAIEAPRHSAPPAARAVPKASLQERAERAERERAERAERERQARSDHRDAHASVEQDVEQLSMSTLTFQDYVRDRMLKRRQTELARDDLADTPPAPTPVAARRNERPAELPVAAPHVSAPTPSLVKRREAPPPLLREDPRVAAASRDDAPARRDNAEMMTELRSMRGLIEQRFGALAFMEKLQRYPRQAQLTQKLLDCGFSPSLIKKMVESLPNDIDENDWAASVLERNLGTGEHEQALEDMGGVYALIGPTGVGKTTSTAKLAAAFATKHGAGNLGLITLDAYRVAAHEQLRTYGRILGVPVHTAHDRASLEDLLELLAGKRMVLIDTAGMAQRDERTRELLEMISHRSINKLLVVNAAVQGETVEDVLQAYAANACRGVVLSKMDEAVKLAPALDALIRRKLKVLAVANGQRVPEDWHRLSANALVARALRGGGSPAWRVDGADVNLIFAGAPAAQQA